MKMTQKNKREKIESLLQRVDLLKANRPTPISMSMDLDIEGLNALADKERDLKPLLSMLRKIKDHFNSKIEIVSSDLARAYKDINSLIDDVETKFNQSDKNNYNSLYSEIQDINAKLSTVVSDTESTKNNSLAENSYLKSEIKSINTEIEKLVIAIDTNKKEEDITNKNFKGEVEEIKTTVKETNKKLDEKVNKNDFIERFSRFEGTHRGGSAHRKLLVNSTEIATTYADINFITSGLTMVASNDNTRKITNVTITASGSGSGYQAPLTGDVNGVNDTFTWITEPNVLVVDGVPRQKVQSDGTVNWTGTTTTVLAVVPTFDLFGAA